MSKPPRITKAQAAAFRKRWKLMNDREAEELRTKPVEDLERLISQHHDKSPGKGRSKRKLK